jgi:hypothetical protein
MFKAYDSVMVLSVNVIGNYYDILGKYLKKNLNGTHLVEVNSTKINVPTERLMNSDEYFKLYHSDKSKLPDNATKQLWVTESDYRK